MWGCTYRTTASANPGPEPDGCGGSRQQARLRDKPLSLYVGFQCFHLEIRSPSKLLVCLGLKLMFSIRSHARLYFIHYQSSKKKTPFLPHPLLGTLSTEPSESALWISKWVLMIDGKTIKGLMCASSVIKCLVPNAKNIISIEEPKKVGKYASKKWRSRSLFHPIVRAPKNFWSAWDSPLDLVFEISEYLRLKVEVSENTWSVQQYFRSASAEVFEISEPWKTLSGNTTSRSFELSKCGFKLEPAMLASVHCPLESQNSEFMSWVQDLFWPSKYLLFQNVGASEIQSICYFFITASFLWDYLNPLILKLLASLFFCPQGSSRGNLRERERER